MPLPRWLRMVRATLLNGLAFAVLVASVRGVFSLIMVFRGGGTWIDLLRETGVFFFVSFILGVLFSGVLALAARGRRFSDLSLPRVALMGAGAGLIYFLAIGLMNAFSVWTPAQALLNFTILTVLGSGAATSVVLVARRGQTALPPEAELARLADGDEG